MLGLAGQRLVGRAGAEPLGVLAAQPQRARDDQQLLVVEVPGRLAGVQPGQPRRAGPRSRPAGGCPGRPATGRSARSPGRRPARRAWSAPAASGRARWPARPGLIRSTKAATGAGDLGVGEQPLRERAHRVVVLLVRVGPGGAPLGLAGRLLEVGRQPVGVDRPGADQGLPDEVLGVRRPAPAAGTAAVARAPAGDRRRPTPAGSSDSTASRARTSSARLVSWVDSVVIASGQSR